MNIHHFYITQNHLRIQSLLLVQVFEKIPALLFLYLHRNQLKEVPSGLPTTLEQLRLGRNLISKIPAGAFNKMGNLTLLDLYHNQVNLYKRRTALFSGWCEQEKSVHLVLDCFIHS